MKIFVPFDQKVAYGPKELPHQKWCLVPVRNCSRIFLPLQPVLTPGKNSAVGEHGRNKITTIYQQISTSQGKNTAVGEHGHNSLVQ